MSSPSYWSVETDVLMSYEEIENLNRETIQAKGTNMYDLKNLPEIVDGISLNETIKKSSQADAQYYIGWTYFESTEKYTVSPSEYSSKNGILFSKRKPSTSADALSGQVYSE
jgi:hypothetical protein